MSGQHHIGKFIIHCSASEKTGREAVRVIASTKDEIIAVIHNALEQYASIPETITIKNLHLDLGRLYVHELPAKFKDRLASLLEAELKAFFNRSDVKTYLQQSASHAPDPFHQLHRYLRLGFDEHLQQDRSFDAERFILELLDKDRQRLASVLEQAWSHDHARKRLQQLSPGTRLALRDMLPSLTVAYTPGDQASTAFTILLHYYSTGYFPEHARLLWLGDLEMLVRQALKEDQQKLAMHLSRGMQQAIFRQRLAETLTLALLKEITEPVPSLSTAWQEWQALETAGAALTAPRLLYGTPGKLAFLQFIAEPGTHERAGVWIDYVRQEAALAPEGFSATDYLRALAAQVKPDVPRSVHDVLHDAVVSAGSDVRSRAPETTAEKTRALNNALDYFRRGLVSREYNSASQLFNVLLAADASGLKALIMEHWNETAVRYRLAWQAETPLLQAITRLVWKDHASYGYWKMLFDSLQQYGRLQAGEYKNLEREAHARYFDYLSGYGASWNEARFSTWMKAGLEELPIARTLFLPSIGQVPAAVKKISSSAVIRPHDEDRVLEVIRFYYHTGHFPQHAGSLQLSDLEILIDRLLTMNEGSFIGYFQQELKREPFAVRLSETISFSTLKRMVGRVEMFGKAFREWNVWEEWLQVATSRPVAATPHTKMLFLRYVGQAETEARLQTALEYFSVAWTLQDHGLAFRTWLQWVREQQGAAAHDDNSARLAERLMEMEAVAGKLQDLPHSADHRISTLARWLRRDDDPDIAGAPVTTLLQSLLTENADALAVFFRAHWQQPEVRASLALHISLPLLEAVTTLVWQEHSSYAAWKSFQAALRATYIRRGEKPGEQVTRALYHHYFEFLSVHAHEHWEAQPFRQWMYTTLRESLPAVYLFFEPESAEGEQPAGEVTLPAEPVDIPGENISPTEALAVVKYYYQQGHFPGDSSFDLIHLEWLVNRSMALHSPELVQYVVEYAGDRTFITRLSETLSLTLLEKIVTQQATWLPALQAWKALHAAFEAAGLSAWLPLYWRKRSLLMFVSQASPEAQAQSVFEHFLVDTTSAHRVFEKIQEVLRGKDSSRQVEGQVIGKALVDALLKEAHRRLGPSPEGLRPELPEEDDRNKIPGREGEAVLSEEAISIPPEDISATAALALVKHYYDHGRFPADSTAKEIHLEWLVGRSLEYHQAEIVQYIAGHLDDKTFVSRLTSTLSHKVLEKIREALRGHESSNKVAGQVTGKALEDALLQETLRQLGPPPEGLRREPSEETDLHEETRHEDEAVSPGEAVSPLPEDIPAAVALAWVEHYYDHGRFPADSTVKEIHLEWLVNRSLEYHRSEFVQYVSDHISDQTFVSRLTETLSWELLEKIIREKNNWRQSYEGWQALLAAFEVAELLSPLPGQQRKIFMLAYVHAGSAEEKAQLVFRHFRPGVNVTAAVLAQVKEALRYPGRHEVVIQEITLVMDKLEAILYTPAQEQKRMADGFMAFLLTGADPVFSRKDIPALAGRLLNIFTPALADQVRRHWAHQPLRYRYRIASLDRRVLEGITELVWGTHPSYALWNTFISELPQQPDDALRRDLYFLYFNDLHRYGETWHEMQFRDRMAMGVREYNQPGDVARFWNTIAPPEGILQRIRLMLQEGLQPFLSKRYGRPVTHEDVQRFWDGLLLQEATLFGELRRLPVKDDLWKEITTILTVAQLQQILYNLTSFQFSHLDHLRRELERFVSPGAQDAGTEIFIRTWYQALFIMLHEQGSAISKDDAGRHSVQYVFQQPAITTLAGHLQRYGSAGADIHMAFPILSEILTGLWPELVKKYLPAKPSPGTTVAADIQPAAIKNEFSAKYDTGDLILYYLRTGEFPSWSAVQDVNALRKTAEQWIAEAPAAKLLELGRYLRGPEIDGRLKNLLSPQSLRKFYRSVMNDTGEGESPAHQAYSTDLVMERQRVELLLHLWIFHELPWWLASCDLVVKQDAPVNEDLLREQVLQHHLEALLFRMKLLPAEAALAEKLMAELSLPFFYKIITTRFPAISGFVITTFSLFNESLARKEITIQAEAADLYTFVYRFLLGHAQNFSSRAFIHQLFLYLWNDKNERKQFAGVLFNRAETLRQTSDTRFWIISELLKEPDWLLQDEDGSGDPLQALPSAGDEEKRDDDRFREMLVSYIRFGTIPPYAGAGVFTREDFLEKLQQQFRQEDPSVRLLIKRLLSNLSLLEAFVQCADELVVDAILELLSAGRYAAFISWKTGWVNFIAWALQEDVPVIDKIAVKTLFALLQNKDEFSITPVFFIRSSFESLFREVRTVSTEKLVEKIQAYKEKEDVPAALITVLEETVYFLLENERFRLMQSLLAPRAKTFPADDQVDRLTGRLMVQNAGIVILGPFLYRYFNRLQMLEGNKFKSEDMALRAVHLLQFLVSGNAETPEHAMILNKILCGVEITTPIDRNIELTVEEKEVSESLLHGVLENWDKLKTRSIDALREGFLMRDGYLEETELGWELEVERKAMDILVDLIPWSFNMIKLSWMEKSLATTWQSAQNRDLLM